MIFWAAARADSLQPAQHAGVSGFYRPCNVAYRLGQGLDRLERTDIGHRYEVMEKLPLRLQVEPDQHRLWLAFGLLVVDVEGEIISHVPGPHGLHHHGGQQHLITDLVAEQQNPVIFFF